MYKKKLKRREEKEENNKIKDTKTLEKRKNRKKLGRMVAPIHNFDPKLLPEKDQRSCDGRGGGQGTSYFIASVVLWKENST
jgi:hypothetical protein